MASDPMISVEGLSKTFQIGFWMKNRKVLNDVSFTVDAGECVGFLGPNGAGKTTTLKCLLGLLTFEKGRIRIQGQDSRIASSRAKLGYMPDNPYFYDHLKGEEFLDLIGRLHSIPSQLRRDRINELFALVRMEHARKLELRKYSKGMLQRIGIAQALINDPDIAIFDEPMEGLDPIGRKEIRDLMRDLNQKQGKTIFFSTHILPDIEVICNRVIIISKGELQGAGTLSELLPPGINSWEVHYHCESEAAAKKLASDASPDPAIRGNWITTVRTSDELQKLLSAAQATAGVAIVSVIPQRTHIEDIFYERFGTREEVKQP